MLSGGFFVLARPRRPGSPWGQIRARNILGLGGEVSLVRRRSVAGPGNVWGPGTGIGTVGSMASQVVPKNEGRGR